MGENTPGHRPRNAAREVVATLVLAGGPVLYLVKVSALWHQSVKSLKCVSLFDLRNIKLSTG